MSQWSPNRGSWDPARSQYPDARPSRLIVAAVLMLMIVIGITAWVVYDNRSLLFTASGSEPPTGPVGAVSAAPTRTAATAAPVGNGVPGTPPPSSPAEVIARFISVMQSADLTLHFDVSADGPGVFPQPQFGKHVSVSLDMAGHDYEGRIKGYGNTKATFRLIAKDGIVYGRIGGSPWIRASGPPIDFLADVLPDDALQGIQDVGVVRQHGEMLHHLRLPIDGTSMCRFSNHFVDFWVRADGQPSSGLFAFECTNSDGHGRFEWSKFGEPMVIRAPARFIATP